MSLHVGIIAQIELGTLGPWSERAKKQLSKSNSRVDFALAQE